MEGGLQIRQLEATDMSRCVHRRAATLGLSAIVMLGIAPGLLSQPAPTRVSIGDLDTRASKYLGRVITVDAEVDEVYGPRLFTIDDPEWGDLGGEVLIHAPALAAVVVRDEDRVTVTGTLQTVALADIEGEWGWRKVEPDVDVDFLTKPLIVATRIVSTDDQRELYVARAASGAAADRDVSKTIMDVALVAAGTEDLVGRPVHLRNVRVLQLATQHGFFVDAPAGAIFVLPERSLPAMVAPGDVVTIQGVIANAPRQMPGEFNPPLGWNRRIYVVATKTAK
jgi:hypothetical protein